MSALTWLPLPSGLFAGLFFAFAFGFAVVGATSAGQTTSAESAETAKIAKIETKIERLSERVDWGMKWLALASLKLNSAGIEVDANSLGELGALSDEIEDLLNSAPGTYLYRDREKRSFVFGWTDQLEQPRLAVYTLFSTDMTVAADVSSGARAWVNAGSRRVPINLASYISGDGAAQEAALNDWQTAWPRARPAAPKPITTERERQLPLIVASIIGLAVSAGLFFFARSRGRREKQSGPAQS